MIFNRPPVKATGEIPEFSRFGALSLPPPFFGRNYVWYWKYTIFGSITSSFFRSVELENNCWVVEKLAYVPKAFP